MGRRKAGAPPPERPLQKLGAADSVTHSLRIPLDLTIRMENLLHRRMVRQLITTGCRAEANASTLMREALVAYLPQVEAEEDRLDALSGMAAWKPAGKP